MKFRGFNLCVLLLIATPLAAVAQMEPSAPYRWHNVTVGGGGFAPGVIFSRARAGLAYLRTDTGGANRWDNAAQHWTPLTDGLAEGSYQGVESIAADPVDADTVYLAAGMYRHASAAILRSHDRGKNWQVAPLPIRMGGNEDGRGLGERLAIDPAHRQSLLFGSRHDGLWRSDDGGATWARDMRFPYAGRGLPEGRKTNAGISFILFDPRPGSTRAFAAVADMGAQALYQSDDSGAHWQFVTGGPSGLLPVKADMDSAGKLYITFADDIGPSGIMKGAVWSLSSDGAWRNITPDPRPDAPPGGYMGVSVDWRHPGTLMVSTVNRWKPIDTIWRSTDAGAHWTDIGPISRRDTSASPFLKWGKPEADFGHWIAGLAIDPFDSGHVAYTTGATLYATREATKARAMSWSPWTRGIEQTAIITLISPTGGAPVISGFGDLGGFVHADLDRSPPTMFLNPRNTNTNTLDYAGRAPEVVVRSGNVHDNQVSEAGLGWSGDGGAHWSPLHTPDWADGRSLEANGRAPVTVSADGKRLFVGAEHAWISDDRGAHWTAATGVSGGVRIVADKIDPARAWAVDYAAGQLLASRDGGLHFAPVAAKGACTDLRAAKPRNRESQSALVASPFRAGTLYLLCDAGLYRSTDGGAAFSRIDGGMVISLFGLGRGITADAPPTIFTVAGKDEDIGIWRSTDNGRHWQRIDDAQHNWGHRFRVISGDPRRFGRIYIGTDGRGIVYGDPVK